MVVMRVVHANRHINDSIKSICTRIRSTDSPTRDLCIGFISWFIVDRVL